jgi:hypothetical protein
VTQARGGGGVDDKKRTFTVSRTVPTLDDEVFAVKEKPGAVPCRFPALALHNRNR